MVAVGQEENSISWGPTKSLSKKAVAGNIHLGDFLDLAKAATQLHLGP